MANQAQVRRIALALPDTEEASDRFAFSVRTKGKSKGFAWVWHERVDPKRPRVPNPGVLAVRVANLAQKDVIIASDPVKFFTEPHYNGFPAVLVRLAVASVADMRELLHEAWRCQSPASSATSSEGSVTPRTKRKRATRR